MKAEDYKKVGNELYGQKKYAEAIKAYEQAIQIDPNYKEAWLNKGFCHKALNQRPEARAAFKKALEIDPNYEKARYNYQSLIPDAHVFFGIVDLKFMADGSVKILEFGKGFQSGFVGYDRLYPEYPITANLIKTIGDIKPFYCGTRPGTEEVNNGNLESFLNDRNSIPNAKIDAKNLQSYKGIYGGWRFPSPHHPDILVMDNWPQWAMVCQSYLSHIFYLLEL